MSRVARFMSASIASASSSRASRRLGSAAGPSTAPTLLAEQPVNGRLDVDLGRIQDRQASVGRLREDERELRPAENQPIDALAVAQLGGDGDEAVTRLVEDHAVDELLEVDPADPRPLYLTWDDDLDPGAGEPVWVERRLHDEPRPEQP